MKVEGRRHRRSPACLAALLALLALPGSAPAKPGALDRSFGQKGKTVAAIAPDATGFGELNADVAWAGHGKLVVAGRHTIVEYLHDGRPNRHFGQRGRIAIRSPEGIRFVLRGVAVDSRGRVLIAGTSQPATPSSTPGPPSFPGPSPKWATVTRYLPDGRRDPSFGSGGTMHSTLGLPPPEPRTGFDTTEPPFHYRTPAVEVTGLALDSEDRPILSGTFVTAVTLCYPSIAVGWEASYLARLSTSGDLDPSFHGGAPLRLAELQRAESPVSTPDGRTLYISTRNTQCLRGAPEGPLALGALEPDGQPSSSLVTAGAPEVGAVEPTAIAVGRDGEIFAVDPLLDRGNLEEVSEYRVTRLAPNGKLDTSFGYRGFASLPAWVSASALTLDRRGRILVAGSASFTRSTRRDFMLARLRPSGKLDRKFGRGGIARTSFGRSSDSEATRVLVDSRGRIVVGGTLSSPRLATGHGVALARYLGR